MAVGLIAFWALGLTTTSPLEDPTSEGASLAQGEAASGDLIGEPGAAPSVPVESSLVTRLYTDYGFRVGLDPAWTIQTGAAGIRVTLPVGHFFVLRTPAPTRLGASAHPPEGQEAVSVRRVAGTDILCTVDPGAPEATREVAKTVCATVTEQGGLGVLTLFKCEAADDIDLTLTAEAVEAVREEIVGCFTVAHRSEVDMAVGQASVAVEPSPDGVPLTILVGGDVPSERSFRWLKGCMTDLFRQVKYTKQGEGNGLVSCEFKWSLE